MKIAKLFLFSLLLPFLLTGCRERFEWRQKLTVTVETPSGPVSGSAVTQMVVDSLPKTLPDAGVVDARLHGEAVVVEVAPGRYLFALLDNGLGWAQAAYDKNRHGSVFEENMRFIVAQKGGPPMPLPADDLPLLATFGDVADPETVRRVDPADLAASFGPGVRLTAVTLEITGEPVTEGKVEAVLGWWLSMRSGPYNEMNPLKLPNDSPRGWDHLGALAFWSLDRIQEFDRRNK